MRVSRPSRFPVPALLGILGLVITGLCGCSALDRVSDLLYPSATTVASAPKLPTPGQPTMIALPATLVPPSPAPTHTALPETLPATAPALAPTPSEGYHLVYAQGGSIFRAGYLGQEPVEIASVPQLESWDFAQGVLAAAQGRALDLINLQAGQHLALEIEIDAPVEFSQVMWGASGQAVLYAATFADPAAEGFGRTVALRAISAADGSELGRAAVNDVTGVRLLHYDDQDQRAWLGAEKGEPTLAKIDQYDLRSGEVSASLPIHEGVQVQVSADGRSLVTVASDEASGVQQLHVYELGQGRQAPVEVWPHPADTHSDSHIWSPDDRQVAFLLRDGLSYAEATQGRGLWVLDRDTMQAREILTEASLSSSLLGWSPDGSLIMGHHRGEDGAYFYVIRPDGGGREILTIEGEAQILGWMRATGDSLPPKIVVDPWRARFLDAQDNPAAVAEAVAQFVAAQVQSSEEILTQQVGEYLLRSGWPVGPDGATIIRLDADTFVAQLPPQRIVLLDAGRAQSLAYGDVVLDARLVEDELGLTFGSYSGNVLQPSYLLLRLGDEGLWQLLWAPQGQRDWIATDGEIHLVEGLDELKVRGSSFGLDLGEQQVFVECRECSHRWFVGTWVRDGDAYVRQTELPAGSSLAERYWEMTELRPYAILDEFLRRARQGRDISALAQAAALQQAEALGLLAPEMRLRPEEESPDGVRFANPESELRLWASVENGQVIRIEALQD
jgi:hypothetical protein